MPHSNIFAWLKKHKLNPVTGEKMTAKDVTVLNMHRNAEGKWSCPATLDEFKDGTHVVAIKNTGNVYSYEAVKTLNIDRQDWKDLTSGETFTRADIIHIHDPSNLTKKLVSNFYHIKNSIDWMGKDEDELNRKINLDSTTAAIIASATAKAALAIPPMPKSSSTPSSAPSNSLATPSFTATNVTFTGDSSASQGSKIEQRTSHKGRVQLVTNFGPLEIILHCDLCPKTCENFMLLIERGYYDGLTFHRNIPNFMIQGGDPDGNGRGGKSAWGDPFEDEFVSSLKHDSRGVLAMANRGPKTNTSQFFILYKSASHLDGKHTVFGKVTSESLATLKALEAVSTDSNSVPTEPIRIIKAGILFNPLDAHALSEEKASETRKVEQKEQEARDRKERGLWYSNPASMPSSSASSNAGVGKYIAPAHLPGGDKTSKEKKRSMASMNAPPPAKRAKPGEGSGWSVF